jgi:hypothetical protein
MDKIATTPAVNVTIDGRKIIANGLAHLSSDAPLLIEMEGLVFEFQFISDSGGIRWSSELVDIDSNQPVPWSPLPLKPAKMVFKLFNHTSPFGTGMYIPINVANLRGKQLSLTYEVRTITESPLARVFSYTFLL